MAEGRPPSKRGRHNPREAAQCWEADRNLRQRPTLFSSPYGFKPSVRMEWMQVGGSKPLDAPTQKANNERKARITLAKVWNTTKED